MLLSQLIRKLQDVADRIGMDVPMNVVTSDGELFELIDVKECDRDPYEPVVNLTIQTP